MVFFALPILCSIATRHGCEARGWRFRTGRFRPRVVCCTFSGQVTLSLWELAEETLAAVADAG